MNSYYIALEDPHKEGVILRYKEVKGYSVKIEGLEGIDLFAHREQNKYSDRWAVSEGKTGRRIPQTWGATKREAIAKAATILKEMGKTAFIQKMSRHLTKGHTPRYDDKGELVE